MSEFTKGEWEADTLYGDHYVVFANDHVVADCFKNAENAQLIAEAPTMYELLNRTLKEVKYMSNFTKGEWEADTLYGDHYVVFANNHVVADCFKNAENAQLIAEAPAMYKLLNRTLKEVKYMSNFTKGEWEADTLYGDHYVVFANNHVVADCFKNAENAQLIAEAPAMYKLLNRTLDFFVKHDVDDKLKHDIDYCILRANGSPLQCVYKKRKEKNNGEV